MRLVHRVLILILLPALTGAGVSLLSLTAERQVEARLAEGDQAAALVRATYEMVAVSHDLFDSVPSTETQGRVDLALSKVVDLVGNLAQRGALVGAASARAESDLGALRSLVADLAAATRSPLEPGAPGLERLHTELAQRSRGLIELALGLERQTTAAAFADLTRSGAQLRWQIGLIAALVALASGALGWTLVRGLRALQRGAEAALEQSEARLSAFFRQSNIGLAITSPGVGWLIVNPKLCALLGYSEDELKGLTWTELTHPDDLGQDLIEFRRVLSGEIDDYELDKRFLRKDGEVIHTHLTVACTRDPDGGVREVQASLLDITAARRATEDLRSALVELQTTQRALLERERLSTIGTLAAGVAHEINNPLMGLLNYVQYARARAAEPRVVEAMHKAERDLRRIGRIVGGMLDFSRPRPVAARPLPLAEPLAQALDLIGPDLARRGIALTQDLPAGLPLVLADPDGLQQVLVNLLLNARDALGDTPNPRIAVVAAPCPAGVRLEVQDNGPGVPAALRGRIFDAFFTTKPPGQGVGLGLTVAAGIVRALAGRLSCEEPPGSAEDRGGALFRIELPAAPAQPGTLA